VDRAATAFPFASDTRAGHAAIVGMWVFLATEVLFFGPWFMGYIAYRLTQPVAFETGSALTHLWLGTLNTAVLMTSSLTMALATVVVNTRLARARMWLFTTAVLGIMFLAIKAIEYSAEWHEGLVPALHFTYHGPHARGVELFFYFYFGMTGLHALHLTIGILVMLWLTARAPAFVHPPRVVEVAGLYWHFIDIIWVFLYPLIYLIGNRS